MVCLNEKPRTVPADDLAEALDYLKESVRAAVKSLKPDCIVPIVRATCLNSEGQKGVVLIGLDVDFDSDEAKDRAMFSVALTLLRKGLVPQVIGIVSEAWHVVRAVDDPRPLPRPADCPDRQEIVSIQVISLDKQVVSAIAPIHRDAQDRIVSLGQFEDLDGEIQYPLLTKVFVYCAILVAELRRST